MATVAGLLHISSAYLWQTESSSRTWSRRSLLAAGLTVAIYPFTILLMRSTNEVLMNAADTGAGKEMARGLFERWGVLNLMRGLLPLAGGVIGLVELSSLQRG